MENKSYIFPFAAVNQLHYGHWGAHSEPQLSPHGASEDPGSQALRIVDDHTHSLLILCRVNAYSFIS